MKYILFLTGMRSTKFGAIERYLLELCQLMKTSGYSSVFQYESTPKSKIYLDKLENLDAKVIVKPLNPSYFKALTNAFFIINEVKPEIVVSNFEKTVLAGGIVASVLGVPKKIVIVREIYRMRKTSILRNLGYRLYDKILCVSHAARSELIRGGILENKVFTHYMGIFGDRTPSNELRIRYRKEFAIQEDAVVLACIAFDKPIKGLDLLLHAFKLVMRRFPEIYLFVIGVDPSTSCLPQQAKALGVAERVCWPGIVDEAWKMLNAADLYIQPSRNEGLPSAVVEAMALKLPVIATPVGGLNELVYPGETGFLATNTTPEAIAESIAQIMEEEINWGALGENGYSRYIQHFKGEDTSKLLVAKYLL